MKKALIITVCSVFVFALITPAALAKWDSPWETKPEINLYSLINEGYKVINTNFSTAGMGTTIIEVLYLQKGKNLYRCMTVTQPQLKRETHECELCQNPRKKK